MNIDVIEVHSYIAITISTYVYVRILAVLASSTSSVTVHTSSITITYIIK